MLTKSKFPVMKIEFAGAIWIRGLVTPSVLDNITLLGGYRSGLCIDSGRGDDKVEWYPLVPPLSCCLRHPSGTRTNSRVS
jgi:hypothetical protein